MLQAAQPELVAAVRSTVTISEVPRAWKPALDQVWAFLKTHSAMAPGHNFFCITTRHAAMRRGTSSVRTID
jgi:hypothetical protein